MKRIFEGSGLFVKLLVSGASTILVISLFWLTSSSYFLGKSSTAIEERSIANRIVIDAFDMRIHEKNILLRELRDGAFYLERETDGLRSYREAYGSLNERIDALERLTGDPLGNLARLKETITDYDLYFTELLNAYRELGSGQWGTRGKWREIAGNLEDFVGSLDNTALLRKVADLRKAEVRYANTHVLKYYDLMDKLLADLRASAAAIDEDKKGIYVNILDEYGDALSRYKDLVQRIGADETTGLQAKFRAEANSIEPLVHESLGKAVDDNKKAIRNLVLSNWIISILGLALGCVIFYLLSRNITRPLTVLSSTAQRIAGGELTVELDSSNRKDEVGALTESFRQLVSALKEQIGEIKEGANILGSSSAEISSTIAQVTASATETATAVTQTMATTEELRQTSELSTEKAGTVSSTARESSLLSSDAGQAIIEVSQAMDHIRSQMEAIGESVISLSEQSQTIGEIISTVDDLAEQSNILSVNASIEAAKTGEHGKGFAVVAQEIKSLAEQSKEATKRVRMILADVQKATSEAVMVTEQGSKAVEKGSEQTDRISEAIKSLGDSIENVDNAAVQIASSSKQQLAGAEQVAMAVQDIQSSSEQNVQSMEQLEKAAVSLSEVGRRIVTLVEKYSL